MVFELGCEADENLDKMLMSSNCSGGPEEAGKSQMEAVNWEQLNRRGVEGVVAPYTGVPL